MLSVDWYKFEIESSKNSTLNLRFICLLFSGDPFNMVRCPFLKRRPKLRQSRNGALRFVLRQPHFTLVCGELLYTELYQLVQSVDCVYHERGCHQDPRISVGIKHYLIICKYKSLYFKCTLIFKGGRHKNFVWD